MHIAVASVHRLPVQGYGGTERIVVALVRGLAALGHRVTLIAPQGTKLREATVVELLPKRLRDPALDLGALLPAGADILHAHFPVRHLPPGVPFLQTLYGNLKTGEAVPPHTVFLSRNHATRFGAKAFVYAGLDPQEFVFREKKDWRPTFARKIKFVGEVDGKEKAELLAGARCLWMPALWDEPFGLTTIEALFSGTPVVATRRGALPEVLTEEVGALGDTLDELIDASDTIDTRAPQACRAHAERWFTHVAQAEGYVRVYEHLLKTGDLPAGRATPWTS